MGPLGEEAPVWGLSAFTFRPPVNTYTLQKI